MYKKLKSFLFIVALLTLMASASFNSQAEAVQLKSAQIDAIVSLLKSFDVKSDIVSTVKSVLQGKEIKVPTSIEPKAPKIKCPKIVRNLYLGKSGSDVKELQEFLKEKGFYDYPDITGYFGPATERAVQEFQKRYGVISSGSPEFNGFGVFGPKTRAMIKKICGYDYPEPKPWLCPAIYEPVCAVPKSKCPVCKGDVCLMLACLEPAPKTYSNKCEMTKAGAKFLHEGRCEDSGVTNPEAPQIETISGPASLKVGQKGKWKVKVRNIKEGDYLSYSWSWGDEKIQGFSYGNMMKKESDDLNSSAEASHIYYSPGLYKIKVTVRNQAGLSNSATVTVKVKDDAAVSLQCQSWYDGCNTCSRAYPGAPAICTKRYCALDESIWSGKVKCLKYFDDYEKLHLYDIRLDKYSYSLDESIKLKWNYSGSTENKKLAIILKDENGRAIKSQRVDIEEKEAEMKLSSFCNSYFSDAIDGNCNILRDKLESGLNKYYLELQVYSPENACFGYCAPDMPRPEILDTLRSKTFDIWY